MTHVKAWVACVENKTRAWPHGSRFLYSEPHPTEQAAQDWAWAIMDIEGEGTCELVRVEPNIVPASRVVKPLERS